MSFKVSAFYFLILVIYKKVVHDKILKERSKQDLFPFLNYEAQINSGDVSSKKLNKVNLQ